MDVFEGLDGKGAIATDTLETLKFKFVGETDDLELFRLDRLVIVYCIPRVPELVSNNS